MKALAQKAFNQGEFDEVAKLLINIYDKKINEAEKYSEKRIASLNDAARILTDLGDLNFFRFNYSNASKYYEQAHSLFQKTGESSAIEQLFNFGKSEYFNGNYNKAIYCLTNVIDSKQKYSEVGRRRIDKITIEANYIIGLAKNAQGELNQSIKYFEKAIKPFVFSAAAAADSPIFSSIISDLSITYLKQLKVDEAEKLLVRALSSQKII